MKTFTLLVLSLGSIGSIHAADDLPFSPEEIAFFEQEPSIDIDIAKMLLDELKQNLSTISNPATDDQELDGYLVMIESIQNSGGNPSAYEELKKSWW